MRAGRNRRPSSQSASFDVGILPKRGNLAFKVEGTSKTKPTETKVKGGALIGALVRGAFSGSAKGETTAVGKLAGMGTGAAIGAGVGTMVSAATPGPSVAIPAESQIDFYLASPISGSAGQRQRGSATRAGISSRRPGTLCARRYSVGSACCHIDVIGLHSTRNRAAREGNC
jgi:hypothetical protein